jgi:pimeloyl-ACP methyl ester carboxylesterase
MALAVTEHGPEASPSVVLLHGLGTTGWMWDRVLPHLAGTLHCLVVDLPGHGASNGRAWVSVDDAVEAVAALVAERTREGAAAVAGLSLGGYVAARLAAQHPDVVPVALVSGVSVLPFPRPRLMAAMGRIMSPMMRTGPVLRANARGLKVPEEDVEGYLAAARTMARGTFLKVGAELIGYRVPPAAASSGSRVLAVAGTEEHELIRRSVPLLARAFPKGAGRLVPGRGHGWAGEDPALFAAVLSAHLTGTALPEGALHAAN